MDVYAIRGYLSGMLRRGTDRVEIWAVLERPPKRERYQTLRHPTRGEGASIHGPDSMGIYRRSHTISTNLLRP